MLSNYHEANAKQIKIDDTELHIRSICAISSSKKSKRFWSFRHFFVLSIDHQPL